MAVKINLMPQKEGAAPGIETRTPFYSLIIFVLFVVCLLAYGGIYYYNNFYLKKQLNDIEKQNADIQNMVIKTVTPEDASSVIAAITRGKSVRTLLSAHIYETKIYELLEKITISEVIYTGLSEKDNGDKTISLSIKGEASSFNILAKQLVVLKKTKEVKNVIFLEALAEKDGKVSFSYVLILDSNLALIRPYITLTGPAAIQMAKGSSYTDAGATAVDGIDGVVDVKITGTVNTDVAGTYILTFTANNTSGNSTIITRTVNVVE